MKVIHLTPAYKPAYIYGGPTMSVAKLCEALVENNADLDLEVICTKANGLKELPVISGKTQLIDGVQVTYYNRITKDHTHFSPALLKALRQKIKEAKSHKSDLIIHIHSWWNLVAMLGALIAKWYSVPIVLSPRGMVTSYTQSNNNKIFKSLLHRLLGKSLLKSSHLFGSSQKEITDFFTIATPISSTIIPNIVELPKPPILFNRPEKSPFKLLYLSRIEEKKGIELLFKALKICSIDWTLTIAGTGNPNYIKQLKNITKELNIDNNIVWIGHQNNTQKFEIFQRNDLLCLTSYNENFANVVVESLYFGLPVLISNEVGLAPYVKANNLGFITDLDIETISRTIEQAYDSKEFRKQVNTLGSHKIMQDFSPKNIAEQVVKQYRQIIHSN